jgi:hypothetical protein
LEDHKHVEKRTEIESEKSVTPGVTNVNIGPDGTTNIQSDVVDEPARTTTVREETEVEEHSEP